MFFKKDFKKAFTLIETLIAVAIFTVIIGIVSLFARDTIFYKEVFFDSLTASDDARHILQPIANEIRSASPSSLGSYPLETVSETILIFYTDIDDDGLKDRVKYYLNGDIFTKSVIKPTGNPLAYAVVNEKITPLINDVANAGVPIFSYYDTGYDGASAPMTQPVSIPAIRLIKINLVIDDNPTQPPAPFSVTTQVSLRNLKDNL